MGGGLLQLVAYGAQDAYLIGNPQITFWKSLYKRHSNFAMEPFRINFTGQVGWGGKHTAILGRHADLLYSTYLEVVMPAGADVNNDGYRMGYNLIKYVDLDIGGQLIDRLYSEYMFLWDCLTSSNEIGRKLFDMVGMGENSKEVTIPTPSTCSQSAPRPELPTVLYVPLPFFYTRNPGCALPLIALQYHEVKINIQLNDVKFIASNFTAGALATNAIKDGPTQAAIYVDYIYLDTEERRRMAQQSHEYLIEQVQYNEDRGITTVSNRIDLTFNHPVKELIWVVQPTSYTNCSVATAFGETRLKPFTYDQAAVYEQWIQINGQDRLDRRFGDYYNKVQMYQHHTGSANPQYRSTGGTQQREEVNRGIYVYSFALKPEEHQPSGTCNFSRIDTATIVMTMNGGSIVIDDGDNGWDVRVYATNYNILRIMNGMAGLAYSN